MTPAHPEKIGKYTITGVLGRGAMGMVYEGHDAIIDRKVAIKVINKSGFDDHEQQEAMDRFKREAQAAGKLSHANIVMVYEYGEDNETAFISMEYVAGRTLQEIMESDHLTIGQVQDFMVQLLDGLDYAHTHHVTHRDIKPANLVYTDDGKIKIMDFGIAKVESSSLTQVGTIMGTPAYMAPELFTGETVDHRTDLFAVAVILYQLLTGLKPFTGDTMSIIMHKVVNVHPPQPSELNKQLPKVLDNLLRQALSKQRGNRFGSASEFKKELLVAFKKLSPQTKTPRQSQGKTDDQTIMNSGPSKETTRPPLNNIYFIGAGLVLLLLICFLFFRREETDPQPDVEPSQTTLAPVNSKTTPIKTKPRTTTILRPTAKKITRHREVSPNEQQEQPAGISINGRNTSNEEYRPTGGISISTPRRD